MIVRTQACRISLDVLYVDCQILEGRSQIVVKGLRSPAVVSKHDDGSCGGDSNVAQVLHIQRAPLPEDEDCTVPLSLWQCPPATSPLLPRQHTSAYNNIVYGPS